MKQETVRLAAPTVADVMGKNLPEKKYRAGAIQATIWSNTKEVDGKQTHYLTVSFERSYLDKNKQWQTTNSLRTSDLPKAILVLSKAYEYVTLNSEGDEEY